MNTFFRHRVDSHSSATLMEYSAQSNGAGSQQGFSLLEVLIAALILAFAVAGVMRLHTGNMRETAENVQLQQAYWIVSNMYERYQKNHALSALDETALKQQAAIVGLDSVNIINNGDFVGLNWKVWDTSSRVQRGGCSVDQEFSCIQVRVK